MKIKIYDLESLLNMGFINDEDCNLRWLGKIRSRVSTTGSMYGSTVSCNKRETTYPDWKQNGWHVMYRTRDAGYYGDVPCCLVEEVYED